jgi:chitinase
MRDSLSEFLAASLLAVTALAGCGSASDVPQVGSGGGSSATAGTGGALAPAGGSGATGGVSAVAGNGASGGTVSPQAGAAGDMSGGGSGAGAGGSAGAAGSGGAPSTGIPDIKVVGYLPTYSGSLASWASKVDFTKMTHLDLAFGSVKAGTTDWAFSPADADVKTLVDKAHATGTKVLISIGGASADISIINAYATAANIDPLVTNLDTLITRLNLDGVDVDVERGGSMSASTNFGPFVDKLNSTLKPKGKLVTAALAQYIISAAGNSATVKAWLASFDFINVMIYSTSAATYTRELNWWTGSEGVPKTKLAMGVPFYGNNTAYKTILAADATAWSKNSAMVNGSTVNYVGVDLMKQFATTSKDYGGIMFWELSQDAVGDPHSLWKAIQDTM